MVYATILWILVLGVSQASASTYPFPMIFPVFGHRSEAVFSSPISPSRSPTLGVKTGSKIPPHLGPKIPAKSSGMGICESLIRKYEAIHNIPHKLLTAISLVESGRKVGNSVVAWPWTINANGTPYIFATKKEAIRMVRKLRMLGITSIDVGCMQVNLKQHPKAFPTLEAAFDPAANIAYAGKFLKTKQVSKGSWASAVAHYHSATPAFHVPYAAKVLKTWQRAQKGTLYMQTSINGLRKPVLITPLDLEKHKGEFIRNVETPSGRRLPLKVRFAPYKGFGNTIRKVPIIPTGAKVIRSRIIRGIPTQGYGKIIINNRTHQGAKF